MACISLVVRLIIFRNIRKNKIYSNINGYFKPVTSRSDLVRMIVSMVLAYLLVFLMLPVDSMLNVNVQGQVKSVLSQLLVNDLGRVVTVHSMSFRQLKIYVPSIISLLLNKISINFTKKIYRIIKLLNY